MGYQKQYQNLDDKRTQREAINDLIRFIGKRRTKVLLRWARRPKSSFESFAFYAGMAGVEGFPVQALWRYIHD